MKIAYASFAALALVCVLGACSSAAPRAASTQPAQAQAQDRAQAIQAETEAPSPPPSTPVASAKLMAAPAPQAAAAGDRAGAQDQGEGASSEEYKKFTENPFKRTLDEKLSTFAIDVDTASYANARRYLNGGSLPPRDAVRIEEMVNYFDYSWKEPSAGQPIALSAEAADCPWSPGHRLLVLGLRTRSVSADNLPPANLVFLVDSSGSMSDPDKLPIVKRAFALLAETLRPQDRVAIAVYAGSAGLVLPSTAGGDKVAILSALENLEAGGSTAGGEGIVLAYETAMQNFRKGGNNRVILATDGDFNVGASSEAELVKLVESYRDKGVFLSVIGVGTGNLKDSRMKAIADKGNGNYNYADSIAEARRILVEQMGANLLTVAKDVKVQVEFDPASVKSWRLIGYESRLLAAEDFADDKKDAGEMGAGHRVTALYEIEPAPSAEGGLGMVRIRYKKPAGDQSSLLEFPLPDKHAPLSQASSDFRFAASVAAYGMLLRGSEYKGAADWDLVLGLAKGALGEDRSGRRAEFVGLAEKASKLGK
jgi:Ca-activated chloride channel homolog